jgi:hypothetical protein
MSTWKNYATKKTCHSGGSGKLNRIWSGHIAIVLDAPLKDGGKGLRFQWQQALERHNLDVAKFIYEKIYFLPYL